MEYSGYIIAFIVGLYIGFKINDVVMRHTFSKMLDEAGVTKKDMEKFVAHWQPIIESPEEGSENPELEHIEIKIEKHGGCLYAFRRDNDQFLGQGETKEDLIARMGEKLRNVNLSVTEGSEFIGQGLKFNFNTKTKELQEKKS